MDRALDLATGLKKWSTEGVCYSYISRRIRNREKYSHHVHSFGLVGNTSVACFRYTSPNGFFACELRAFLLVLIPIVQLILSVGFIIQLHGLSTSSTRHRRCGDRFLDYPRI